MENYEDNPEDGTDTVGYKRDENDLEYGNYNRENKIQTPDDDGPSTRVGQPNKNQNKLKNHVHKKTVVINNDIGEHAHPSHKVEIQKNNHNIFVKNEINQKVTHRPGESIEDSILDDLTRLFYTVFNKSNIILIVWFLAIYFICYFLIGILFKKNVDNYNYQIRLSKMLDIVLLCFFLLFLIASYYSIPNAKKQDILENAAAKTFDFIENPNSLIIVSFFILLFYVIIYLFRIPMTYETKPFFISLVENGSWILLLIIVFVQFFQIVFNLDMLGAIKSFLNWTTLPFHSHGNNGTTPLSSSDKTKGSSLKVTGEPSRMTTLFNKVSSYFTTTSGPSSIKTTSSSTSIATTDSPASITTTSSPASITTTSSPASITTTSSPASITTTSSSTSKVTTTSSSSKATTAKQGFVGSMKSHSRLSYETTEDIDASHWTNLHAYDNYSESSPVKYNPYMNFGKPQKLNDQKFASANAIPIFAKSENDVVLENKIRNWNGKMPDRNVMVNVYNNGEWK